MKLISQTQVSTIPIKVHSYHSFFKRLKGLMFRLDPIVNEGVLLAPCNSIHMFFMFFPIDVVFLNDKNQIVHLKEQVKPWTMVFPIKNAFAALELPAGSISQYSIQIGDSIKF